MTQIDELVASIGGDFAKESGDEGYSFDPATLILIASILIELFKIWQTCRKSKEEQLKVAKNPSMMERLIVRNVVRKSMGGEFGRSGRAMTKAILKNGSEATVELIEALNQEALEDES